nr:unnamed protein product [Digitaria exilis]CAB3480809.1 unnamed protein product [Digitaria exilis]
MWEFSRLQTLTRTLLLAVTAAAVLLPQSSSSQDLQIGLPGCPTSCGDVSVPYPFAPGCSLAGFNLTCDTTHTPPRLLVGNGTLHVTGVSLDDYTVRVLGPAMDFSSVLRLKEGWSTIGTWGGTPWGLSYAGPYVLSETHNEFILWGCNVFAEVRLASAGQLITSCGSVCEDPDSNGVSECALHYNGSGHCDRCYGVSCCQMPVPIASMSYFVKLTSMLDSPEDFAGVIAEEGWLEPSVAAEAARTLI